MSMRRYQKSKVFVCLLVISIFSNMPTTVFANQIVIENDHYRYEFSSNQGLSLNKLVNKRVESHNALFNFQQGRAIFDVKLVYSDGTEAAFKSTACRVERIHIRDNGESKETIIELVPKDEHLKVRLVLTLVSDGSAECLWRLKVRPEKKCLVYAAFPILQGLRLGKNIEDVSYFHPRFVGIMNDVPIELGSVYGQYVRMQFMEAFNNKWNGEKGSGVVYIVCRDTTLERKTFELSKRVPGTLPLVHYDKHGVYSYWEGFDFEYGVGMALYFNFIAAEANEEVTLPEVAVGVTDGGWQKGFNGYKAWVKTWYKPDRPPVFSKTFFLQATHLFEIDELEDAKAHVHDGIDAFTARLQSTNKVAGIGYHGNFGPRPDWGLEKTRQFIQYVHNQGAQVHSYKNPLYAKEICTSYKKFGKNAQVMRGTELMEGFGDPQYCIGFNPYKDFIIKQYVKWAGELGYDVTYVDCVGWATSEKEICDNPLHNHKSSRGYLRLCEDFYVILRKALKEVDKAHAMTTEGPLVDYLFQYVDGTYDYNVRQKIQLPDLYTTPVHFLRFAFPDFRFFEIMDTWPDGPECREEISWIAFNGVGVYAHFIYEFQGSGKGLYEDYLQKIMGIIQKNVDAFSSESVEPLLPTEQNGLFANKFVAKDKKIYTFMNTSKHLIAGELLKVESDTDHHFVDLTANEEVTLSSNGKSWYIVSSVKPGYVKIIAELPKALKFEQDGINVTIECDRPGTTEFVIEREGKVERQVLVRGKSYSLAQLSNYGKDKVYAVLLEDELIRDQMILPNLRWTDIAHSAIVTTSNDKEEIRILKMNAGGTEFGVREKLSSKNIIDGDPQTQWRQDYSENNWPAWVQLEWKTSQKFNQVIYYASSPVDVYVLVDWAKHYILEYSRDGRDWIQVAERDHQKEDIMDMSVSTFPTVEGKYLRLKILEVGPQGAAVVNSLEVYLKP